MKLVNVKTSTPSYPIFIVTPSLEGWATKAKEAPSPHEARLALLDTSTKIKIVLSKSMTSGNLRFVKLDLNFL